MITQELITAIFDRIKELDLQPLHIDLYNNQLELEEQGQADPFALPAVFVRIEPSEPRSLLGGAQDAMVEFYFIVATRNISRTDSRYTGVQQQKALSHIALATRLHTLLHRWSSTAVGLNTLTRVGYEPIDGIKGKQITAMRYRARVLDRSAATNYVDVSPPPELRLSEGE